MDSPASCQQCKKPLPPRPPGKRGPDKRKYCSLDCYHDHQRTGLSSHRTCEQCGAAMKPMLPSDTRRFCSKRCFGRSVAARVATRPDGTEVIVNTDGYVWVYAPGYRSRGLFEHRLVMEGILGRPLYPGETVHHLNGIKHDNTPSNLELWVTPQPYGQRPADLVDWVVEHYPELVAERMNR